MAVLSFWLKYNIRYSPCSREADDDDGGRNYPSPRHPEYPSPRPPEGGSRWRMTEIPTIPSVAGIAVRRARHDQDTYGAECRVAGVG